MTRHTDQTSSRIVDDPAGLPAVDFGDPAGAAAFVVLSFPLSLAFWVWSLTALL